MRLTKWQLYFLVLVMLALPFITIRIHWLNTSIKTKSVVLYVNKTRIKGYEQRYPVFQYETKDQIVTVSGNYNLPYVAGDSVNIRYNPRNELKYKIDTLWDCWKDLIIYPAPFLLFITMIFFAKDIIPSTIFYRENETPLKYSLSG
jgi:hypothetical protein